MGPRPFFSFSATVQLPSQWLPRSSATASAAPVCQAEEGSWRPESQSINAGREGGLSAAAFGIGLRRLGCGANTVRALRAKSAPLAGGEAEAAAKERRGGGAAAGAASAEPMRLPLLLLSRRGRLKRPRSAGAPRRRTRGARGGGPVSGARRPRAGRYRLSRPCPG